MQGGSSGSSPSSSRRERKEQRPYEVVGLCYNCKKLGHYKIDCSYSLVSKHQGKQREVDSKYETRSDSRNEQKISQEKLMNSQGRVYLAIF